MRRFKDRTDRIAWSRSLLITAIALTVLSLVIVTVHCLIRGPIPTPSDRACFRALDLSSLSLTPSGSPWRNPDMLLPGVDLRYSPALFRSGTQAAELLLTLPGASGREGRP